AARLTADELAQPACLVELVDPVAHPLRAGPELLREGCGEAEVRVEDVQRSSAAVAHAQVRADPRLLAVLEAAHVMVRDRVRLAGVVMLHPQLRRVYDH